MDDRTYCLSPYCDEPCRPNEELCETHQQEENPRQKGDDDGVEYGHPSDYKADRFDE